MKQLFTTTSMILCAILSYGQEYTLTSNIATGLDADSLLIVKIKDDYELEKIPVSNGQFHYRDTISEPYFVQLILLDKTSNEPSGKLAEFMVEAGEIVIEGNTAHYDSVKVSGSESDRILKHYFEEDAALTDRWGKLKVSYDTYVEKGDSTNRKLVAQQLNDILVNERIPLLKRHVRENSNRTVGALLPIFCTLDDVLRKEDYTEMYQLLDEDIQKTSYGKSILSKAEK